MAGQNEPYGLCECGAPLEPVFFREKERIVVNGVMQMTGRSRMACSHLICTGCMKETAVDDSFDGPWE